MKIDNIEKAKLVLKRAPNGGWTISHHSTHLGEMAPMFAAFTDTADMLSALSEALLAEAPVKEPEIIGIDMGGGDRSVVQEVRIDEEGKAVSGPLGIGPVSAEFQLRATRSIGRFNLKYTDLWPKETLHAIMGGVLVEAVDFLGDHGSIMVLGYHSDFRMLAYGEDIPKYEAIVARQAGGKVVRSFVPKNAVKG